MSNPTTPFSWQMPTATDLVTDLPADFEVFGQAVATSLADLLGGTTGQVLKKNTNADMDFVWSADSAGMTNPMTTTGDIIYSSPGSTPVRLGIGSTGNVLTVAGGVPSWAAPAGGGKVLQVINATYGTVVTTASNTYQDTNLSASITPSSASSKVLVLINQNGCQKSGTAALIRMSLRLLRGATVIHTPGELFLFTNTANDSYGTTISASYLDSPATTSSTTYKTQFRSDGAYGDVHVQANSQHTSSITLLEIGA